MLRLGGKGSLFRWLQRPEPEPKRLTAWPIFRLPGCVERVNQALTEAELEAIRTSAQRGSPFGDESWMQSTAKRLNLEPSLRPRGCPRVRFDPETEKIVLTRMALSCRKWFQVQCLRRS